MNQCEKDGMDHLQDSSRQFFDHKTTRSTLHHRRRRMYTSVYCEYKFLSNVICQELVVSRI